MIGVYLMAVLNLTAGYLHFARFRLFPATRSYAAWTLMVFLVLIFPANIYMCFGEKFRKKISPWLLWLRLPVQGVLVWWAYQYV
jgi:uncharacterized membrane protein